MKNKVILFIVALSALQSTVSRSSNDRDAAKKAAYTVAVGSGSLGLFYALNKARKSIAAQYVSLHSSNSNKIKGCNSRLAELNTEISSFKGLLADLQDPINEESYRTSGDHLMTGYPIFELLKKNNVDLKKFYEKSFLLINDGIIDAPSIGIGFDFGSKAIDPDTGNPAVAYLNNDNLFKNLDCYRSAIPAYVQHLEEKKSADEFRKATWENELTQLRRKKYVRTALSAILPVCSFVAGSVGIWSNVIFKNS